MDFFPPTYDLRNRWSQAITAFCQFTNADLKRERFEAKNLTSFCNFLKERDYVFTQEDLRCWCVDEGYNYAPFIRLWMSYIPEWRIITPTWSDPEAITIAVLPS